MAIYKLDETPNIFISPYFYDKFVYRMVHHIDESNYSFICDINLRKDKLVIHGTEINETTGSKLSDSLHLRQKTGKLFVNCDGACYIYVIDKGTYRPIDNVIFDWSPFGVTVPNSVNDVLRKELHQKEQKLSAMSAGLSSTKGEVEELGKQLMTSCKNEQDKEMELQKLYCQLSVKEFELEATKNMFGLSKEEVKTLKEHLSSSKKENTDAKTRQMQDGFSSVQGVLQSIKTELESSNKNIKDIKEMVKQNQVIVTELRKIQNEISSGNSELQLTKRQLESSGKKVIELEEELSACKMEGKAKEVELHKMKMKELESVKILLELAGKKAEDDSFGECNAIIKVIEIVE